MYVLPEGALGTVYLGGEPAQMCKLLVTANGEASKLSVAP